MDIFDSYSSRSGKIFLTEIYKYSKQINSQNTSQSILFTVCVAKFGTNQPKSLKAPSMFSKLNIPIFLEIFQLQSDKAKGTTVSQHDFQAASSWRLQLVVIHSKFAFSRLEEYGYCLQYLV